MRHNVAVVYRSEPGIDAISQYSRHLTAELNVRRISARYCSDGLAGLLGSPVPPTHIVLQYNPFRWGRSGFAPGLLRDVARLRRQTRAPLTLMVHEGWIDVTGVKSAAIGGWQRVQLRALLTQADSVITSSETLALELGRGAVHVPPASNILPVSATREQARERLGLDSRFLVTLFGRGNPSRALDYAEHAIAEISRSLGPGRIGVVNLGAGAPPIGVPAGVQQLRPGELVAERLSLQLHASDLVLLPFTDGVTTRRTTLMAALAHGSPVLGLTGPRTDSVLRQHPAALSLTPLGDRQAFADEACRLAGDAERRRRIGEAGRALYEARFDWPVVGRRIAAVMGLETSARNSAVPA